MLSRTYEHFPRSAVLKYFDVTDINSIFPFLTLNKHPAAATFEASVVNIRSSSGFGTVSFNPSTLSAFAEFHALSSMGPHVNSFFLSRKLSGYSMCLRYGKNMDWYWKLAKRE